MGMTEDETIGRKPTTNLDTILKQRHYFANKGSSLLFNMLSRLVIVFLPRSKHLLISQLQSPSAVILEPKKIKCDTVSTVSPSICHEVMEPVVMILVFLMLNFKPGFSLFSFTFIKRLFSSLFSAIRVMSSAYLSLLIFLPAILIPACASLSPAFPQAMEKVSFHPNPKERQCQRMFKLVDHNKVWKILKEMGIPGHLSLIPRSGRFPGEGNGNPLQYSCLENPMDGRAWCPRGHRESHMTERLHFLYLPPEESVCKSRSNS